MRLTRREILLTGGGVCLVGCSSAPETVSPGGPQDLGQALYALAPARVSRAEAQRAAQVSFAETAAQRVRYDVTDPPLVHNAKVNLGIKARGLCNHWADDLQARLAQERLSTLTMHRVIANYDGAGLQHSAVALAPCGATWTKSLILDGWRTGGQGLFWSATEDDPRFDWALRDDVLQERRRLRGLPPAGAVPT